jgi:hypothetical protein
MWLLTHCLSGAKCDSVVGDLVEQYAAGRSRTWFWYQTFVAVALGFAEAIWSRRLMTLSIVLVDEMLPVVYNRVLSHWIAVVNAAWYPKTWNWLTTSAPDSVWRVAVWLEPWWWTSQIAWCAILVAVARVFVVARPSERRFIAAGFILLNVIHYVVGAVASYDPANAAWAARFVWYTASELVLMPVCILVGAGTLSLGLWRTEAING